MRVISRIAIAKNGSYTFLALPISEEYYKHINKHTSGVFNISGITFRMSEIVDAAKYHKTPNDEILESIRRTHNTEGSIDFWGECSDTLVKRDNVLRLIRPYSHKDLDKYIRARLGNPFDILIVQLANYKFKEQIKQEHEFSKV